MASSSKCSKRNGEFCRLHNPSPSAGSSMNSIFKNSFVSRKLSSDASSKEEFVQKVLLEKAEALAVAAVPRDRSPEHEAYFAATDLKHMGDRTQPGSKFMAPNIKRVEDVLALAVLQRGNLSGDDRSKFIALGASADAFQEGKRYIYIKTPGTVGVVNSSTLKENDLLEVVRTKPGVPCSLVVNVKSQPKTDYAVAVLVEDKDTGKDMLITTFPGVVTKSLNNEKINALEGKNISVVEARRILGENVWVNTKVRN